MVVSSLLAPFGGLVGVAVAQQETCERPEPSLDRVLDPTGAMFENVDYAVCTVDNLVSSLFGDEPNSVEIETLADANNALIEDTNELIKTDWANDKEAISPTAMSKADGAIIEAHYNGQSESQARIDGQNAIREEYAAVQSNDITAYNQMMELTYAVSKQTTMSPDVDTLAEFSVFTGTATPSGYMTYISTYYRATDNSSLTYENFTLANGDEIERVNGVTNVEFVGDDSSTYDPAPESSPHISVVDANATNLRYNIVFDESAQLKETGVRLHDPFGSSETRLYVVEEHLSRMSEIGSMLNSDLSDVDSLTAGYYTNYQQGELEPSDSNMWYLMQSQADSGNEMAYSVLKFAQLGMSVDLGTSHEWEISNTTYSGYLATSASLPLVADEAPVDASGANGSIALSNIAHGDVLTASNETATIEFVDSSTLSDVDVTVHNVDDATVNIDGDNITVNLPEAGLEDDFVTFSVSGVDANGDTVESGTYIVYVTADAQADGIPRGMMVGETYNPADYTDGSIRGVWQTAGSETVHDGVISQEFTLTTVYGEDGNERAYVLFEDNTPTTYTSNNLQDRLKFTDDVQNALDNNLGGSDNGNDDGGISSLWAGLGGFVFGIIAVMGVGFVLLVLYLVGRITSVA
jgi:hypothetical protein